MKPCLWKDSIHVTSHLPAHHTGPAEATTHSRMGWRHFIGLILLAAYIGSTIGCDEYTEADAKRRRQKDAGIQDSTTDAGTLRTIEWRPGGLRAPGGPEGSYSLQFVGYPSNRLLLTGSTTYTEDGNRIEPITLQAGEYLPMEVRVGSEIRVYNFQIVQLPSLPPGTYLLDLPGAMEEIVNLAASWPDEPISFKLRGNTNGSGGGTVIPPTFRDSEGSGVDFVVTVTIPSADAPSISTLPVTRIGIQQKE